MPHALPVFHLVTGAAYALLAAFILVKNARAPLNQLCALLFVCFVPWTLGKAVTHNTDLPAGLADFFIDFVVLGAWTFPAVLLWLTLVFIEARPSLRRWPAVAALFAVPAFAVVKQWTVGGVLTYELRSYGWGLQWEPTITTYVLLAWFFLSLITAAAVLGWHGVRAPTAARRKQSRILAICLTASFAIGYSTNIILPRMGIQDVPDLAQNTALIMAGGFVFAIARYEFLVISPATAADKILTTMADALILLDRMGQIVTVNPATTLLTGYPREELVGQSVRVLLDPTEPAVVRAMRTADQQSLRAVDITLLARSGLRIPVSFSSTALQSRDGVAGHVCIARDITERKAAEAALLHAREEAERLVEQRTAELARANEELLKAQKLESLGVLAGGIAHDFNNILVGISISLGLASSRSEVPEVVAVLEEAEAACSQASRLTHQLLTFSRGGAPVMELVSISELLEDTAEFALRGSNVRLDLDIAPNLWAVEADLGQLAQCVHNLVLNAVQAMPDGGQLRIAAHNVTGAPDSPLPVEDTSGVCIVISDQGEGISEDHLPRIFDPYFTTKRGGTGLGLATTYSVIHQHGGHIQAQSEVGRGSTFTIHLAAVGTPSITPPRRQSVAHGTGRILVLDDQAVVRRALGRALVALGYDCKLVADGSAAVEAYATARRRGEPFDLAILDLQVPGGMGGVDALRAIRDVDPNVKAVVSSGYSNDPVMSDPGAFGFMGVVRKPYDMSALSAEIARVLRVSSDNDEPTYYV